LWKSLKNKATLCELRVKRRAKIGEEVARHRDDAVTSARKRGVESHLDFAHSLADLSGHTLLPYFRRSLHVKDKGIAAGAGFDPVTAADRAAERAIRRAIAERFPRHGIIGEEFGTAMGEGPYRWLIDPIDGTRAFITGSPLWGTLIGLLDGERPVLGLMNQPYTRERFWSDGKVARMRTADGKVRRLKTRACAGLNEAIFTATHPDMFATPAEMAGVERLKSCVRMTRYGGDCYGYCLLAAGFIDLIVEARLKPFDIVPLIPIIEAAGGVVTTWEGESPTAGGNIIAAGDTRVHRAAMVLLGASSKR
jgi:myo-inositol-1(or 4)-monophosphatase